MDIPQVTPQCDIKTGGMGQVYLASGKHVALRRWSENPGGFSEVRSRNYEIVGYLVEGMLEIDLDGEMAKLGSGDSWLVPEGAPHRYRVIDPVVAIEATSPPARFNDRDQPT
ncbi:cupin domain-containing protein [Stieleria sp. ICT_E10.1]|uniref:cupin domain-containing protein n=1 Tax=Stieleria sedimenti TaxID=2976331 RepID=UPI0021807047|nr:cupin domain-containing protein [Stieleria sedimenti]MCS7465489.1 cupin domain-containing protein [Stieleria sedimenti]